MSVEENKALVRRIYDFENRHDVVGLYALTTKDYILHLTNRDLPLNQAKEFEEAFFKEFPDVNATIRDMVAEGDKVFVLVTWRGTQRQPCSSH
jgi:ketosteroid isomerase-like protein